ncbi:hypothetical protein B0H67DRAFT_320700 [Lasiosphaeris hirsuta]|uniref:Uncharacterized protein n=1 Tax=Lasiosphaeris hirsuta TaxID=260670 RepID=A0AA40DPW2_9PEZI|nr:hypothetical protein B0H67DRAFT_320700 [Lasiosphaeris hirsuta]
MGISGGWVEFGTRNKLDRQTAFLIGGITKQHHPCGAHNHYTMEKAFYTLCILIFTSRFSLWGFGTSTALPYGHRLNEHWDWFATLRAQAFWKGISAFGDIILYVVLIARFNGLMMMDGNDVACLHSGIL